MAKYTLSLEAQKSLKSIKSYSIKNFGAERTKAYLLDIRSQFIELAENPARGRVREDLKIGYYSYFVGSHTIYYRIRPAHIEIIDVLHQSMDPSNHISH